MLITVNELLTTETLPARLDDAGNFSLERQRAEAQTANAELAQETARPPAELAPVVLAAAELRLPRVFHPFCSGCHKSSNPLMRSARLRAYAPCRNGIPKCFNSAFAWLSSAAVVTIVIFMPFIFSTFE